ncbi:hypothetical protein B7467_05605 [Staphylococcus lugdunensis]|nr:hypothetical protein B7467_05605 [Staphylococcus lugdunensis]
MKEQRAPTQRLSKRKSTSNASWGGAPTQRLSKRKSTNNASWGGPQQREFREEIHQAKQVGVTETDSLSMRTNNAEY